MADWTSGASANNLRARAEMLANIRQFFANNNVLEVETPLLARTTATDVYIQSLEIANPLIDVSETLYLQTSPEYSMKRLLGSGTGAIYQICKAFRQGEVSNRHNPEFTILEWYQPGYSMEDLMDEVERLVDSLLDYGRIPRLAYRELFQEHLNFDPHTISLESLKDVASVRMELSGDQFSKTDYLQLLLANSIEPVMPANCFIYDFPVEQSALAVVENDDEGASVAKRFELFCGGMEIANGYFELVDPTEQRKRFEADRQARKSLSLPEYPIDEKLLAALEHGIPQCSGVALGIDRLLMLVTGAADIREVLSFTTDQT